MTKRTRTVEDREDGTETPWVVVERDEEGMPIDEVSAHATRAAASRSAANRRYAAKTRRPVQYR